MVRKVEIGQLGSVSSTVHLLTSLALNALRYSFLIKLTSVGIVVLDKLKNWSLWCSSTIVDPVAGSHDSPTHLAISVGFVPVVM